MGNISMYLLNVGHGESIYVKITEGEKIFGILVDGGSEKNSSNSNGDRIESKQAVIEFANQNPVHALVVSHVDDDHIGGVLNIIRNWNQHNKPNNFYLVFNDYIDHRIAFSQAETLMDEIKKLKKQQGIEVRVINTYSKRHINAGKWGKENLDTLPVEFLSTFQRRLLNNKDNKKIYITLLTPGKEEINRVMEAWGKIKVASEKKQEGYERIKNEASISFLLEYGRKTILFSGDSSIFLIKKKMEELGGAVRKIDYFNLCHHGAYHNNIGVQELLDKYRCQNIFLSTNSIKYPEHPNLYLLYRLLQDNVNLKVYMSNSLRYESKNIENCFEKDMSKKSLKHSIDLKSIEDKQRFYAELSNQIGKINLASHRSNVKHPINYQNLNELMKEISDEMGMSKKIRDATELEIKMLKEYLKKAIIKGLQEEIKENSRFSVAEARADYLEIKI